jgi:hypothetical protein
VAGGFVLLDHAGGCRIDPSRSRPMTTATDRDKQTEPRLLTDAEIDTVVGGIVGIDAYPLVLVSNTCYQALLPPNDACPG